MLGIRVIPCLLLKNRGLVKTVKFKDPIYLGDPINIVKIFNEKEVDEIVLLDITATTEQRKPNFKVLSEIASECFMPVGYGGGIRTLDDAAALFNLGFEKIVVNSCAVDDPHFVEAASARFGSQSVVVSIDVKKSLFGQYEVFTHSGWRRTRLEPADFAKKVESMGAGELILNSIDRDGTMLGYDLELINHVASCVKIPVVACGGAGKLSDFADAVSHGNASAVAAGSMFVFQGKHKAVLITYPPLEALKNLLSEARLLDATFS
jgi:cyclase